MVLNLEAVPVLGRVYNNIRKSSYNSRICDTFLSWQLSGIKLTSPLASSVFMEVLY